MDIASLQNFLGLVVIFAPPIAICLGLPALFCARLTEETIATLTKYLVSMGTGGQPGHPDRDAGHWNSRH